jgi:hypothetical protein
MSEELIFRIVLLTNEGDLVPGSPVNAVLDGDGVRPKVTRRMLKVKKPNSGWGR